MPSRMVKLKMTIPLPLEHRMVEHWGYAIDKRMYLMGEQSYILFKKSYISDKKTVADEGVKRTIRASVNDNVVPLKTTEGLSKWQQKQLEKRCDNIVNFFPDPYSVPAAVRARLTIIQQHLTPAECLFVQNYMEENFPL
jgi:hypothetical protein